MSGREGGVEGGETSSVVSHWQKTDMPLRSVMVKVCCAPDIFRVTIAP